MPDTSIRVRVPTELHDKFALACKSNDLTASQVIRAAMRHYINEKQLIEVNNSEKKNKK
jgi:antitoxin component of RelBE/YafQ-DinJ toxin-antitoxin module